MFLVKTSFFFLVSSWYSYIKCKYIFSFLFVCLFTTSFLHHSHGADPRNKLLGKLDVNLAHLITLFCLYYIYISKVYLALTGVVYVAVVYYTIVQKDKRIYKKGIVYWWHGSMHMVSTLTVLYTLM
jgi:hypothetical protein